MLLPLACESPYNKVTITRGTIISPNYPYHYDNNKDCRLTIGVRVGKLVLLRFEAFQVQYGWSDCQYDYLEIRDGNSNNSSLIGSRLCGTSLPNAILSTGNSLTFKFYTNYGTTDTGFNITAIEVGKMH